LYPATFEGEGELRLPRETLKRGERKTKMGPAMHMSIAMALVCDTLTKQCQPRRRL